jgi:hypothetical protein
MTKNIFLSPAAISLVSDAHTIAVKSVISAPITPVRYASVVFADYNDTTRKFSAMTNTVGNYQTSLRTLFKGVICQYQAGVLPSL